MNPLKLVLASALESTDFSSPVTQLFRSVPGAGSPKRAWTPLRPAYGSNIRRAAIKKAGYSGGR